MPRTLWTETDRDDLLARIDRLRADMRPLWGKMNATQMLTHLTDWMRMGSGELAVAPRRNFLRYPVVKHLIIYVAPFPKEVPTAPELIARKASDFANERSMLRSHIASLVKIQPSTALPPHPAFGRISNKAWGVLGYRHTDHHLRQFGM